MPYSAEARPKLSRYTVADPYLGFWLHFLRSTIPTMERGRGDVVYRGIRDSWQSARNGFAARGLDVELEPEHIVAVFAS